MIAINVPHATHINAAAELYTVSPALLQAILDEASPDMPELPPLARTWAVTYALTLDINLDGLDGGAQHPEANIMATARWLSYMFGRLQNQWWVVEEFYRGGPRGRMAMQRLASGSYERRRRQWS